MQLERRSSGNSHSSQNFQSGQIGENCTIGDTRDLRDPQKLGEQLMKFRQRPDMLSLPLSQVYDQMMRILGE